MAADLGDDADTMAAVHGQLAGAFYGESGIPEDWRSKLAHRELAKGFLPTVSPTTLKAYSPVDPACFPQTKTPNPDLLQSSTRLPSVSWI